MPVLLGQFVLKRKDNLALDSKKSLGHTVPMIATDDKTQIELEFIARVKAARIATGMKQWQLADALGVPQGHYKHWESSRPLPLHHMNRFCLICRVDPNWLITGHGQKPLKATHAVEAEHAPVRKPRRQKRSRAA